LCIVANNIGPVKIKSVIQDKVRVFVNIKKEKIIE